VILYDKLLRSGKISVDELKRVCSSLGTPITQQEIAELLKEYAKLQYIFYHSHRNGSIIESLFYESVAIATRAVFAG
jgi:Ca2+-binding EF-hand superfamily protein